MSGPRSSQASRRSPATSPGCRARSRWSSVAGARRRQPSPGQRLGPRRLLPGLAAAARPGGRARARARGPRVRARRWGPTSTAAVAEIRGTPVDPVSRPRYGRARVAKRGEATSRWSQKGSRRRADLILVGELAIPPIAARFRAEFPDPCGDGARRWDGRAAVALMFAQSCPRADAVCCAGMLVHAVLCAAHARLAARREWVLNEKDLVRRAGLEAASPPARRAGYHER